jgi:hypothetical protein
MHFDRVLPCNYLHATKGFEWRLNWWAEALMNRNVDFLGRLLLPLLFTLLGAEDDTVKNETI